MANPKANFNHADFTGLAAECFTLFMSTYDPLKRIAMCRKVQALEDERDRLKALLEMEARKGELTGNLD
jgi:hypothetical protein